MSSSLNKITRIQLRRDTEQNWKKLSNRDVVLAEGEIAITTNLSGGPKFKIGHANQRWIDLPYFGDGSFNIDLGSIGVDLLPAEDNQISVGGQTNRFKNIFVAEEFHLGPSPDINPDLSLGTPKDIWLRENSDGKHIQVYYIDDTGNTDSYTVPSNTGDLPLVIGGDINPTIVGGIGSDYYQLPDTGFIQNQSQFNEWSIASMMHLDAVKVEAYDLTSTYRTPGFPSLNQPARARVPAIGETLIHKGSTSGKIIINEIFTKANALPSMPSTIEPTQQVREGDMIIYEDVTGWKYVAAGSGSGGATGLVNVISEQGKGITANKTESANVTVYSLALGDDWSNITELT